MRSLLLLGGIFLASGCTTFESSTYENKSTKEGTVVTATGRAAEVAAGANTSHNCPSCGSEDSGASGSPNSSRTQTVADEVVDRAIEDAGWAISRQISQKIYEILD